jgi:hypothetical protein
MNDRRAVSASIAIFLTGVGFSAAFYFSRRPIRFNDAVISNFLSPGDNPGGYLVGALGTAIAGVVLAPTAFAFYRRMGSINKAATIAASAFYGAGLLAAISIACLSPVRGLDFSIHLVLAYVAFISLQIGISIYLTVAAYGAKSRRLSVFTAVEWALPASLLVLSCCGPDSATASCEWGLCATIAAGLWVLTTV